MGQAIKVPLGTPTSQIRVSGSSPSSSASCEGVHWGAAGDGPGTAKHMGNPGEAPDSFLQLRSVLAVTGI